MHLKFRGVNDAFRGLVNQFDLRGESGDHAEWCKVVRRPSRNGSVLVIDEPVCLTYEKPLERVLFNAARDVNVFAVLYEALYMLAGRNDVAPLVFYSPNFKNYSDDGKTLNGSYGYRWRHMSRPGWVVASGQAEADQLDILVAHLKADPTSRRAVLQMWNVEDDLLKIGRFKEGGGFGWIGDQSLDVCCNLSVMFSLRSDHSGVPGMEYKWLDMTVTNRSNDLVWGLLGANFVTFSVLLEYMAARLGAEVGRYHHFSNNLHVYDDPGNPKVALWKPAEWLADRIPDLYGIGAIREHGPIRDTFPLVSNPAIFEEELPRFIDHFSTDDLSSLKEQTPWPEWKEPFLRDVAHPMMAAFRSHKIKGGMALEWAAKIKADDWRLAATNWLTRRINKETK